MRASPWLGLLARSAGSVAAVVALALLGAMPQASAHVQLEAASSMPPQPPEPAAIPASTAHGSGSAVAATSTAPPAAAAIVLNTATSEELQRLPGVGAKRAAAILALRERLGRFRRVEDLLRVKGIGRKSLKRIAPLVVLEHE